MRLASSHMLQVWFFVHVERPDFLPRPVQYSILCVVKIDTF